MIVTYRNNKYLDKCYNCDTPTTDEGLLFSAPQGVIYKYPLCRDCRKELCRKLTNTINDEMFDKEIGEDKDDEIKFISYDGRYPNLCSGTLVLEKGGKQYRVKYALISGGRAYFTNNYSDAHTENGDWSIDKSYLPLELQPYVEKITELVNENVQQGCCGGCL